MAKKSLVFLGAEEALQYAVPLGCWEVLGLSNPLTDVTPKNPMGKRAWLHTQICCTVCSKPFQAVPCLCGSVLSFPDVIPGLDDVLSHSVSWISSYISTLPILLCNEAVPGVVVWQHKDSNMAVLLLSLYLHPFSYSATSKLHLNHWAVTNVLGNLW